MSAELGVQQPAWESAIPENRTIWKTLAKAKYRLDDDDLRGHVYDREFDKQENMVLLYLERDVQNIAWDRYGGPVEYWIRLKVELDAHLQKHRETMGFRFPHDYQPGGLYDLSRDAPPIPEQQALSQDPYIGNSLLLAKAKVQLPEWMWTRFNHTLDVAHGPPTPGADLRLREEAVSALMRPHYADYPARPEEDRRFGLTTYNLEQVLKGAPSAPEKGSALWGSQLENLTLVRWGDDAAGSYEWSDAYLERVFAQLCSLVSQYGLGECRGGWKTVRWLVYDKYTQSLPRGMRYDTVSRQWLDDAKSWLDEHQYAPGTEELRASLRDRCESGRRFNALLPVHPPSS